MAKELIFGLLGGLGLFIYGIWEMSEGLHNDISTLQIPLENRTFFQMDQTAPENQGIFWNIRTYCQNTNLDCHLGLRSFAGRGKGMGICE